MQLIGMLDSPCVRRVAVAMLSAGVPFEHKPISLFRHIDAFSQLSPLLKAPTLIAEDGVALVESSVILEYLATRFPGVAALRPQGLPALRALGAALTVMEKAVQACAIGFVQGMVGDVVETAGYTRLAAFAARAEALPAFRAAPAIDGVTVEALR